MPGIEGICGNFTDKKLGNFYGTEDIGKILIISCGNL